MNRRGLFQPTILFITCSIILILRHAGVYGPNSDTAIFPLTALHLMQGKPFPFFFYGQDYMGTLPVLFILISFKTLGVSYLLVEFFYALVIAGIITLFPHFYFVKLIFLAQLFLSRHFSFFLMETL